MEFFESFLKAEVNLIVLIQNRYYKCEQIFGYLSTFFGSTFMYLYLIPLLAAFNTKLYQRMMLSCVTTDFLNLILKWIISEDRPYWWVHETKAYTNLTRPTLYQTERTCETSPGSPSGHLMLAACFLNVIYDEINKQITKRAPNAFHLKFLNRFVFISILSATTISRMYFAAHFLHQCIFGCILGIIVSSVVGQMQGKFSNYGKAKWLKIAIAMSLSTTAIFWLHKLISGNPMKSVHLAFKYCTDPLHPKPETTVVFSAIRSVSFILGILLSSPLKNRQLSLDMRFSWITTLILMIAQVLLISSTPKTYKILVFYSYTFVVYAFFTFSFAYLVPKLCSKCCKVNNAKIKEN